MSARAIDALDMQLSERDNAEVPLFDDELQLAPAGVLADEVEIDPAYLEDDWSF